MGIPQPPSQIVLQYHRDGRFRIVALLVGGIEALGLISDKLGLSGRFWDFIGSLNDNFGELGYLIIGIFVVCWLAPSSYTERRDTTKSW